MKPDGILFADLAAVCTPSDRISDQRILGKWNAISYEVAGVQGTLLTAMNENRPEPVYLNPALTGWHRIYVGLAVFNNSDWRKNVLPIRLTGDPARTVFNPDGGVPGAGGVEESFWKCADMTGEAVEISRFERGCFVLDSLTDANIAWIRFEPMTEKEVEDFKADQMDDSHRCIYATNDMHCMAYAVHPTKQEEWEIAAQVYEQSDVEWLSVENLYSFDGKPDVPFEQFPFSRLLHKECQDGLKSYTDEMLQGLARRGHEVGLKMCASHRMGAWGVECTWDEMYFENSFRHAHPQLRCVDRDGHIVDAMSYAYPETQDYIISMFLRLAADGFDAVEMMYNRGVPYTLFEQPLIDAFQKRYGENICEIPSEDPRVIALRCEIMTGFVRRLRKALDERFPERHVRIHARGLYSIYDCRYVGVDMETWAKEHLIDAVISYPQSYREDLTGDIWQEGVLGRIDLEKYSRFVEELPKPPCFYEGDFREISPRPDTKGVPQGPKDQKERIGQWMKLSHDTDIPIYFEIMPRQMPKEVYMERVKEIYDLGGERISLWDAYSRAPRHSTWNTVRRVGHKETLDTLLEEKETICRRYRFLHIGRLDVSRFLPCWGA